MLFIGFLAALNTDERNCAEEIFEKYHKLIYEIAYGILHKHQDAEDTLDEVMINIIKNIDKFMHVGRNDTDAQIVIYSRNAAINLYNKNKRRSNVELSFNYMNAQEEPGEIEIQDSSESVDEIILTKETAEIVRKHLKKLSIEHRDVIKLVYGLGYSNVEAARVLHITPNVVGLRLYKAKKQLLAFAGGELHERI